MNKIATQMHPVKSSQIAAIGHHPETNTLIVQFPARKDGSAGSVYHYENFDAAAFEAFKNAESIGSHFGKHIKPNTEKHPFMKIETKKVEK